MGRRRGVSGTKLVSRPIHLFNTIEAALDLNQPRHSPRVPSSPPSTISSIPSSPETRFAGFEHAVLSADECEELLDYDPIYEQRKEEAYLDTLGSLQGRGGGGRNRPRLRTRSQNARFEQLDQLDVHRAPATSSPTAYDSLARRLSSMSSASKLSKRRTLRLSRSVPALNPTPPVISHPMPLGAARRIRKMPSTSLPREQPKNRLSVLPRMFAWRP